MTPSFTILATGPWEPPQLRTTWTDHSSRPHIPELEELIEAAWTRAAARPGIHLFDGPMCRLESFQATPESLLLHLSPTRYKPFLGTNLTNPQIADRFGPAALANPIGMSAILLTCDHFLLLGQRGPNVAYHPDRIHPFAGALEPRDAGDPFAGIRRELAEELALHPHELPCLTCAGLVQDNTLRQPELVFAVTTTLPRAAVESRLDPTEHRAAVPLPATPAAVEQLLASPDRLTPVAEAALTLWRRLKWEPTASSCYAAATPGTPKSERQR